MKDNFLKHKKKIIIAILTIAACFFKPIAALIPSVELVMPDDSSRESQVVDKVKKIEAGAKLLNDIKNSRE